MYSGAAFMFLLLGSIIGGIGSNFWKTYMGKYAVWIGAALYVAALALLVRYG